MPASVASSSASTTRQTRGEDALTSSVPLFPLLAGLEPDHLLHFSYLGLVIEAMQVLAFAILPHATHGETLTALGPVLYATLLPVWDQRGTLFDLDATQYLPLLFIAVGFVVSLVLVGVVTTLSRVAVRRRTWPFVIARWFVHATATVLYWPLLNAFLAYLCCAPGNYLWSFGDGTDACLSGTGAATFALSLVAAVLLLAVTLIVQSALFDIDPLSAHPLSRPHGHATALYVLWKTLVAVMFHVLVGRGQQFWFAVFFAGASAAVAVYVCTTLPLYQQRTSRGVCGVMVLASLASVLTAITTHWNTASAVVAMDMDCVLFFCFALPCAAFGGRLADYRVNPAFLRAVPAAVDGSAPEIDAPFFPRDLPAHDQAYPPFRLAVEDVFDLATSADETEGPPLLVPFLETAAVATDVEVAARFVDQYVRLTKFSPGVRMLVIAARIFTKGLTKFFDADVVSLGFANMLYTHAGKSRSGLTQLERMPTVSTVSLPNQFHSYRLGILLKADLNMRDANYQKVCNNTKKLYKDSLEQIALFWTKLLAEQQDFAQLFTVATQISTKRTDAFQEFTRAFGMNSNDRSIAARYANFLDHVMMEPERSEALRAALSQEAEERKWSAMRGARKGGRTAQSTFDIAVFVDDQFASGAAAESPGMRRFRHAALGLGALFLLLVCGLFVYTFVVAGQRRTRLGAVEVSGVARTLAAHSAVLALEQANTGAADVSLLPLFNQSDAVSAAGRSALQRTLQDVQALHSAVAYGRYAPATSQQLEFMQAEAAVGRDDATLDAAPPLAVSGFAVYGYDYVQRLQPFLDAARQRSAAASVISDAGFWAPAAFNQSVALSVEAYRIVNGVTLGVLIALFAAGLLLLLGIFAVLAGHASQVAGYKVSILGLFVLVPREVVTDLHAASEERLVKLDEEETDQNLGASTRSRTMSTAGSDVLQSLTRSQGNSGDADADDNDEEGSNLDEEEAADQTEQQQDLLGKAARPAAKRTAAPAAPGIFAVCSDAVLLSAAGITFAALLAALVLLALALSGDVREKKRRTELEGMHDYLQHKWREALDFEATTSALVTFGTDDQQRRSLSATTADAWALSLHGPRELEAESPIAKGRPTRGAPESYGIHDNLQIPGVELIRVAATTVSTLVNSALGFSGLWLRAPSQALSQLAELPVAALFNASFTFPTTTATGEMARAQLFGYTTLFQFIGLRTAIDAEVQRVRTEAYLAESDVLSWALAALPALLGLVAFAATLATAGRGAILYARRGYIGGFFVVAAVVVLLTSVALCGTVGVALKRRAVVVEAVKDYHVALEQANVSMTAQRALSYVVRRYPQTGDLRAYNFYFDLLDASGLGAIGPESTAGTRAILRTIEKVSMALAVSAYAPSSNETREVNSFTWDLATEPDAAAVRVAYPDDPLLYTNTTADTSRSRDAKIAVSRAAIFGQRYADHTAAYYAAVDALKEQRVREVLDRQDTAQDDYRALLIVATCAVGVGCVVTAVAVVLLVAGFVQPTPSLQPKLDAGTFKVGSGSGGKDAMPPPGAQRENTAVAAAAQTDLGTAAGGGLLLQSSVGFLALLLALLFTIGYLEVSLLDNAPRNIDRATAVGWHSSLAMLTAEQTVAGSLSPEIAVALLEERTESLLRSRTALLYGAGDGYNVVGRSTTHDALWFGRGQTVSAKYSDCGYLPPGSVAPALLLGDGLNVAVTSFISAATAVTHASLKYAHAIDGTTTLTGAGTTTPPSAAAQAVALAEAKAAINTAVTEMRGMYFPLHLALRESADLYLQTEKDAVNMWHYIFVGGCATALVSAVLVAVLVLWPLSNRLSAEHAESTLMLKMMPSDIRENVPAIAQFIDSAITAAGSLAPAASGGDSTYTAPIIVIDSKGTVLKFNSAAEDCFGYDTSEVVGNNVKMLCPEDVAINHDGYLQRYLTTGVRRIVGYERQVRGRRKDGSIFPLGINVKELRRATGDTVFIGFVHDITRRTELGRIEELNDVIQDLATVPIIAIDSLGTVTRFNRASERCFGHHAADVLGQNIKMLMPESIAKHHDAYLANYLRTREKNVIDSVRRVVGLTKNGEEFVLELAVKEISTSDLGSQSTYLGFARDLTADLVLEEANRINDEVSDLSPIPIIGIDSFGKVIKFSRAAEEKMGYPSAEVLGQNVKMLMPDSIARHHDGYLEAYRKTGKKYVIGSEREVVAMHKDGTEFPVRLTVGEAKKEGMQANFLGYLVDIREEKQHARSSSINDAVRHNSSTPIITMNAVGTILTVNPAVGHEFGYRSDEMIGQNIKMITPEEIAVHHDEYLRTYRKTRKRNVIGGQRRAPARRKNGQRFMVEIRVEEVEDGDGNLTFVGFLLNLTHALEVEQQFAINRTVLEISAVPMIAINAKGTVLTFSRSAEVTWKRTAATMIGQNVKKLMPQYYAVNHDTYLQRYVETGEQHIIDTSRVVEAEDADGRIFPCEVSVRETKAGDSSERADAVFVGYARDMSRDGEVDQILQRNEHMSNMSPLPLLQIDLYGIIQRFNDAAEHEFKYRRDEVVGRNVKLLMPDQVARQHDGYLMQYRRTQQKRIIGKVRRTQAVRKDGSVFPVEIVVNEIVVGGDADQNFYIGYLRNVHDEVELLKTNIVSGVISDLSPTPLLAISEKGTIIKFNRAAATTFGYSEEFCIGQNVKILMPEDIAVRHDGYLSAYAKTGEQHIINSMRIVRGKKADGTTFPAEVSVRELTSENAQEKMFWGYIRDVTDDFAKEQAVRVADAVQALSAAPILAMNQKGTVLRANEATARLFEYTLQEIVGHNIKMLMPQEIASQHDGYLRTYLATGKKTVIDSTRRVQARKKSGVVFPIEIGVREVKLADGSSMFLGYIVDLSQELERASSHQLNDAVKSSCPIPLLAIDAHGTVLEYNEAAVTFFGYPQDSVIGQNIKMLMPEEVAVNHDGYLAKYRETGVKSVIGTSRLVRAQRRNGITVPVRLTVRELKSSDGTLYVGYVENMSSDFEAQKATVVFQQVMDMMVMPIIGITEMGTIRRFNRAAEADFGYTANEVIGQNIKMLMPEAIAKNHDGYLEAYRRTGEKHVIDSSRNVPVRCKDGTEVPVELLVSEFVLDGQRTFVGYGRNRMKEIQADREAKLNTAVIALSSVPIIAMNDHGTVLRFSRAAEEEFGYTAAEVLGQNVKMLMPEHIAVNHDGYLEAYRKTGRQTVIGKTLEGTARRKSGEMIPVELTVKQVSKSGLPTLFIGYVRNITEDLKQRSNALVCEAIEDLMPDPLIVISDVGIVHSFTPAAQRAFGYTSAEVVGQNVKMLMPPEMASQHDGLLERYRKTGMKHVIDTTRRTTGMRKDGTPFEVELRIKEIASGAQRFFIGYVRDCSDDFQLVLERDLGEALLELNPDALITIDAKGSILRFNKAAEEMFHFDRALVMGRNVKILMPDKFALRHDQFLAHYRTHGVKHVIDDVRQIEAERKNGEVFPAEISVRETVDEKGDPIFVGYVRDLTNK